MVPIMRELGLDASWEVIDGNAGFFEVTKAIHNGLQGADVAIPLKGWKTYEDVNAKNFDRLRPILEEADIVFIHDPQPAHLLRLCTGRKGKWIWRAHIDISRPFRPVWKVLRPMVEAYDASIFSMAQYAKPLPHPQFLVPPSIDPLSEKNRDLPPAEIEAVRASTAWIRHAPCSSRSRGSTGSRIRSG